MSQPSSTLSALEAFDEKAVLQGVEAISDLLKQYGGRIPRYTSYPTAVQFTENVRATQYASWLETLKPGTPLSLYFHVPFCDQLCSFCACNTAVVKRDNVRAAYADLLVKELDLVAAKAGKDHFINHLHWGGGTPTTIPKEAIRRVMDRVRHYYKISDSAEVSMELDPRTVPEGIEHLLVELGFNRVSFGVQDINPNVQEACGRIQSLQQTKDCIDRVRGAGIKSVNVDLIYGLPKQTVSSIAETAQKISELRPDRLAVFGYAHVPFFSKRQQLIDESTLPGLVQRLAQRQTIDLILKANGYVAIGLDHYVLPTDSMAKAAEEGRLHRNFQGYTTDKCEVLVAMGASAISAFPQGLSQNFPATATYTKAMEDENVTFPTWRGVERTEEDRLRGHIIERIMCDLEVDLSKEAPGRDFSKEVSKYDQMIKDGIVVLEGNPALPFIKVTEKGAPFVRNVAAAFDQYLKDDGTVRHSSAI